MHEAKPLLLQGVQSLLHRLRTDDRAGGRLVRRAKDGRSRETLEGIDVSFSRMERAPGGPSGSVACSLGRCGRFGHISRGANDLSAAEELSVPAPSVAGMNQPSPSRRSSGPVPLVSARRAAEILELAGFGRSMAQRVLSTGLAGDPVRSRNATLYSEERVWDLVETPYVDEVAVSTDGTEVVLMQRVPPGSPASSWDRLHPVGLGSLVGLRLPLLHGGVLPLVRTSCGYVLEGLDLVDTTADGRRAITLTTRPPGAWFAHFAGRRVVSRPGHHWYLWHVGAA